MHYLTLSKSDGIAVEMLQTDAIILQLSHIFNTYCWK